MTDSVRDGTALPRTFEDFNEARKLGFLAAKEYKERGGKLAGACARTRRSR